LLLGEHLLLLLRFGLVLIFRFLEIAKIFKVVLEQSIWHFALIEKSIEFSQIAMIKLLISRKILPKSDLFTGHEFLIVLLPFVLLLLADFILLNSQVHRAFDQVLIECFEVKVNLPDVLRCEILKRIHNILFHLRPLST
jgi:hypothetical protein